jgi:hypothetical protein
MNFESARVPPSRGTLAGTGAVLGMGDFPGLFYHHLRPSSHRSWSATGKVSSDRIPRGAQFEPCDNEPVQQVRMTGVRSQEDPAAYAERSRVTIEGQDA